MARQANAKLLDTAAVPCVTTVAAVAVPLLTLASLSGRRYRSAMARAAEVARAAEACRER